MINHISISFSAVRIQKNTFIYSFGLPYGWGNNHLYFCSIIYRQCLRFWGKSTERNKYRCLMMFTRKLCNSGFCLKILPLKDNAFVTSKMQKKNAGSPTSFWREYEYERINLSKSGFVSEEGPGSGCKSQNMAIKGLKGNVLCQIWFKWTY